MDARDVITKLRASDVGNRKLDVLIGTFLGYTPADETKHPKNSWTYPDGKVGYLPTFTTSLEAAHQFSLTVSPIGGVTWGENDATSKVGENETVKVTTPALSLCIATLMGYGSKGK